jgi:hypothetical protein
MMILFDIFTRNAAPYRRGRASSGALYARGSAEKPSTTAPYPIRGTMKKLLISPVAETR